MLSQPLLTANAAVCDNLVVVNRRYTVDYDVYVARPSILGNPFHIGKHGTRDEVVAKYESYAWERMQHDRAFREALLACEGKRVACWCYPLNCHAMAIGRLVTRWKGAHGEKT